jgi:hypothetical protein
MSHRPVRSFFDDPECLAAYLITNRFPETSIKRIWTVDYSSPSSLVDDRSAIFIRSNSLLSPMGANIAAFGSNAEADSASPPSFPLALM